MVAYWPSTRTTLALHGAALLLHWSRIALALFRHKRGIETTLIPTPCAAPPTLRAAPPAPWAAPPIAIDSGVGGCGLERSDGGDRGGGVGAGGCVVLAGSGEDGISGHDLCLMRGSEFVDFYRLARGGQEAGA